MNETVSTRKIHFDKPLTRQLEIRAEGLNEDDRTLELSFSSPEPVSRFFGDEVLDHSAGAVRLERIRKEAPLIFNHMPDQHIGRVTSAKLENGRGVATVKFSRSQLGEEKLQDVRDGILTGVSVGYRIHEMKLESSSDEKDVFRITDWEPLEISLVTIPADVSVGVGRNNDVAFDARITETKLKEMPNDEHTNSETRSDPPEPPKVDARDIEDKARQKERKRASEVRKSIEVARKVGWHVPADIETKADDNGWDGQRVAAELLNAQEYANSRGADVEVLEEARKESKREFSVCRAIVGAMSRKGIDGYEREVIEEFAKRTGQSPSEGGVLIPFSALSTRSMLAGAFNQGGSTVPVDTGPMIPKLDPVPIMERAGATMIRGLNAPTNFPRHTEAAVAHWVAEAEEVAKSTPGTDDVMVSPHGIAAYVELSRQLVITSSIDIEAFVRQEILRRLNLGIDRAALTGSGAQGVPKGVFELNTSTGGVNTVTFGGAPTWAKIVEFEGDIENQDALMGSLSWVTSAPVKAAWKSTPKDSGSGMFLAERNEANGYPIHVTSQLASTDYANRVTFGNFADMIIGMYGAIELLIDQSAALQKRGLIGVTGLAHADVAFRHPESFAVSTDTGNQ